MRREVLEETEGLRESMIAAAGRVPVSRAVLFRRVTDEWGELCERRLDRALAWCVMVGAIARSSQPGRQATYSRGHAVDVQEMSLATFLGPRPGGDDHWTRRTGRRPGARRKVA